MSDEELKLVAVSALRTLIKSQRINTPTTSLDLLSHVMTTRIPDGLLPHTSPPRFKLTDLAKFEKILEGLSMDWEEGIITLDERDTTKGRGKMIIYELDLHSQGHKRVSLFGKGPSRLAASIASATASSDGSRKRKRVVDEDADSAAGGDEDDEAYEPDENDSRALSSLTTLANLSPEMREIYAFIQRGTAKGRLLAERFRSKEDTFEPICPHITKEECVKARKIFLSPNLNSQAQPSTTHCALIHFRPLIRQYTDPTLGHCSYLNTCYSEPTYAQSPSIPPFPGATHAHGMAPPNTRGATSLPSGLGQGGRGKEKAPCRYLHYEVDWDGLPGDNPPPRQSNASKNVHKLAIGLGPTKSVDEPLPPPQWINCDLRTFDYSVLGKFHVIMADPPWDIHMSLPYGTMKDDEMRAMPIPMLQDEGFLFLWVTGRAMEIGRECLEVWGYQRVDEVVWLKTNQLQRVIRTGRTGHWLNHTKEHLLIGVKRSPSSSSPDPSNSSSSQSAHLRYPSWGNAGLSTDVLVSEVRETSRKPDEIYGIIERLCPGGRKVEIFGRKHNIRPGWLTLGNQLGRDNIWEEGMREAVMRRYPERAIT